MRTFGDGKYQITLDWKTIGEHRVYFVSGGTIPHIGGAVICEPGKEAQVLRLEGHYDFVVLRLIAEAACKKYNTTVLAVGGIHIDHATKEEINILIKNCEQLAKQI